MTEFAPFLVAITFFVSIAVTIIALSNHRLKRKMIELGHVDESSIKMLNKSFLGIKLDVLKWGLILFFGGLGLVVLEFVPFDADKSALPYGVEIIFISLGFLVYYFLAKKEKGV